MLFRSTTTARNSPSGSYNERTGFGTVDAAAALSKAGRLMAAHPATSPVASSAHFGGGAAAVPAAPVPPRGVGQLVSFALLAVVSLAVAAGAGVVVLRRARGARRAEGVAAYSGPPPPGYPAGYAMPGTEYGAPDDPT